MEHAARLSFPEFWPYYLAEHNRPATFKHPLFSLLADHKMASYMVTGRLGRELARLNIHPKK